MTNKIGKRQELNDGFRLLVTNLVQKNNHDKLCSSR